MNVIKFIINILGLKIMESMKTKLDSKCGDDFVTARGSPVVQLNVDRKYAQESKLQTLNKISDIGCRISYVWNTLLDVSFEIKLKVKLSLVTGREGP
jgi:hypothetical protein